MLRNRTLFWLLFTLIVLIGIISGFLFFEDRIALFTNRYIRYASIFAALGLITLIGYRAWALADNPWLKRIWRYLYLVSITILIFFGLIDLFVYSFPYSIKKDLHQFRTLLLSPLPFLVFYLFLRLTAAAKK